MFSNKVSIQSSADGSLAFGVAAGPLTKFGPGNLGGSSGNFSLMLAISVETLSISTLTWSILIWRSFREATSGSLVELDSLQL